MTMPQRRTRPLHRGRRFDLRATAMFFGLLAIALVAGGFAVRAGRLWTGEPGLG
ncbi:hypothetical protein [Streptomyces sp. NPDC004976]